MWQMRIDEQRKMGSGKATVNVGKWSTTEQLTTLVGRSYVSLCRRRPAINVQGQNFERRSMMVVLVDEDGGGSGMSMEDRQI